MQSQQLMRLLASAVFASIAATLAFVIPFLLQVEEPANIVLVTQGLNLTMTTFTVAIVHALLFGLPLFLLVRRKRSRVGIVACALGGFVIAAMPFSILALPSIISGGNPTTIDDALTPFGWIDYARTVGQAGLLGLTGGLTFWAAMRTSGSDAHSWSIVAAAAVLTCCVFILPVVVRDRSCHNLFSDGRSSARPQIFANLKVSAHDWKKLEQTFTDFGQAHELSIRRDQHNRDGRVMWRSLDLCNDAGVNINVYYEPWLADVHSPHREEGLTLSIFSQKPGADWKPLARHLLGEIETTWPETITFRGRRSQILSLEDAMVGRP